MRTAAILTAVTLVIELAGAAPVFSNGPQTIGSPDTNQDTRITAKEATAWEAQSFSAFDTNGDGFISRKEYLERARGHLSELHSKRAAAMEEMGADLQARSDAVFSNIDADQDTKLSRSEYMTYGQSQFEAGAGSMGTIDAGRYGAAMGALSFDPMGVDANMDESVGSWEAATDVDLDFGMRDKDVDDVITKTEWQAVIDADIDQSRWENRFSTLDTDDDGRISLAEFGAWRTMAGRSDIESTEPAAGSEEDTAGPDTSAQGDTSAANLDDEDGKWTVWTFRRFYFY